MCSTKMNYWCHLCVGVQGLLGSEIVDAQSETVVINGEPHAAQGASFLTRSGLQVSAFTRTQEALAAKKYNLLAHLSLPTLTT